MVVSELRRVFRDQLNDLVEDYLVDDPTFLGYLNEAQCQAALRANLLYDKSSAFCTIPVVATKSSYTLDNRIFQVAYAAFTELSTDDPIRLYATDIVEISRYKPDWRELSDKPERFIQFDTTLELIPKPDADGTLHIEAYRLPLKDMEDDDEEPEIQRTHHLNLLNWVLYRAYSMPDIDLQNIAKADFFENRFSRIFGNEPHATTRREQQADLPHCNKVCF